MIQLGRYKFGFAQASMIVVFIVLSICAIFASFKEYRPEYPIPLTYILFKNEVLALLATLGYGIFTHFAIALIERLHKNK